MFTLTALAGAGCFSAASAQLLNPAANPPEPATQAEPAPAAPAAAVDQQKVFTLFRHDLINLLTLRADGRLLAAAAQIAAPDEKDPTRMTAKKTPALLKRALEAAPQDPLVLWVAASNACLTKPGCADPAALKTLQSVDAGNAAVWLLAFPADDNAEKSRAIVARMAQTQRYDDYWAADVVALFHALETLPVPEDVARQGVGTSAARINFATSIASAILPVALQRLGKFCAGADAKDAALVEDCIAAARKLESGGTFVSQGTGFAIEEALLTPGVDRNVMATRKRSAAWQKEKFFELSARFSREPALAESYVRLLGSEQNELATVVALMREQSLHTDPPGGWQPADTQKKTDPLQSPATQQ
jgi:hypothetical protein